MKENVLFSTWLYRSSAVTCGPSWWYVRLEFMEVTMKIIVFWDVTSCMFWRFRGTCFPLYPTTRPHCAKSQNTALVRVPYISLCVTSVDLVCPHCEDMPNVDSHSAVRIYVAVLVAGYLWPLAAECTKLQILFWCVSASKGWWAFLVFRV
jgi:hypothetical protein